MSKVETKVIAGKQHGTVLDNVLGSCASATACAPGTTPPSFGVPVLSYDGPKDGATAGYHRPTPPSLPDSEHFPGRRQLRDAAVRESLPFRAHTRHVDGA